MTSIYSLEAQKGSDLDIKTELNYNFLELLKNIRNLLIQNNDKNMIQIQDNKHISIESIKEYNELIYEIKHFKTKISQQIEKDNSMVQYKYTSKITKECQIFKIQIKQYEDQIIEKENVIKALRQEIKEINKASQIHANIQISKEKCKNIIDQNNQQQEIVANLQKQIQKFKIQKEKQINFVLKRLRYYNLRQIKEEQSFNENGQNILKYSYENQQQSAEQYSLNSLKKQNKELKIILQMNRKQQLLKKSQNFDQFFTKVKQKYQKQIKDLRQQNKKLHQNIYLSYFSQAEQILKLWDYKIQKVEENESKQYAVLLNMFKLELKSLGQKQKQLEYKREEFCRKMQKSENCFHSIVQNLMNSCNEDHQNQIFHESNLRIRNKNQKLMKDLMKIKTQLKNVFAKNQEQLKNAKLDKQKVQYILNEQIKSNNKTFENRCKHSETENQNSKKQLSEMNNYINQLRNTNGFLDQKNHNSQVESEKLQKKLIDSEQKIAILSQEIERVNINLKAKVVEIAIINSSFSKSLNQAENKINNYEIKVTLMCQEIQRLNYKLKEHASEIETRKQKQNKFVEEIERLNSRLKIEEKVNPERLRIKNYENNLNILNSDHEHLKSAYHTLDEESNKSKKHLAEYEQIISKLSMEINRIHFIMQELKKQNCDLKLEVQGNLKEKNHALGQQINRLYEVVHTQQEELADTRMMQVNFQQKIPEKMALMVILFAEIECLRKRLKDKENNI